MLRGEGCRAISIGVGGVTGSGWRKAGVREVGGGGVFCSGFNSFYLLSLITHLLIAL